MGDNPISRFMRLTENEQVHAAKSYSALPAEQHPELVALQAQFALLETVADRCGRREGETVAELLKRLHDETQDDD